MRGVDIQVGAPTVPNVKWDDIGGLEDAKRVITDTVELPLRHPQLFAAGLRRRSGVLLYGPPGMMCMRTQLLCKRAGSSRQGSRQHAIHHVSETGNVVDTSFTFGRERQL